MGRSSSRCATTGGASTQPPDIPATSAWTRCAAVRPRSAVGSQSRAHPDMAPSSGSGPRHRTGRPEVDPASDDTIGVLVVDDHEVVRRGLLAFLDSEPDIDVLGEAAGGAEALDLLASMESEGLRPDVVVMELKMTPMDGIESPRRVRALYRDIDEIAIPS